MNSVKVNCPKKLAFSRQLTFTLEYQTIVSIGADGDETSVLSIVASVSI